MRATGTPATTTKQHFIWGLLAVGGSLFWGAIANAQVTPDGTLSTTVSQVGGVFTITNGDRRGNNLFHSFREFSVPTNGGAIFNHALDVQNIFARVTGGSVSNIDGFIRTNGSANLFLINPSGILFGPNASLQLGGSFTASTADSVVFADGVKFSAANPTPSPLLTVSVPVGLQLGPNAGPIRIEGQPISNFFFQPPSFALAPGKTLALVASQIDLDGANLFVPDGRIELWGVRNAEVAIKPQGNWQLASNTNTPDWGTVSLRKASYIDTSGAVGGAINIQGRGLTLQENSSISSFTGANGQGQGINIQTTEFVDLLGGVDPANFVPSGFMTSVTGSNATAGDITIATQRLSVANGAWIQSLNYGANFFTFEPITNATTGNITVRATDVNVIGYNPLPNPTTGAYVSSAITTLVVGGQQNNSGAITVNAERVQLRDGGRISTDLLGSINFFTGQPSITTGKAGDIAVTATQSLDIRGTNPDRFTSAIISSVQSLANGQGGNIAIAAGRLTLADGGTISSAISGSAIAAQAGRGTAGNIRIRANDVEVSSPVIDSYSQTPSGITVALGQNATGQGGNISLTGDRLRVFNGGQITSSSLGQGSAGSVNLRVNSIDVQGVSQPLSDGRQLPSTITASSNSSFAAGSVNIRSDRVSVRDGAEITVSNAGSGDAGNLNIAARNIFLDNGASLRAEVNGGNQGNIRLRVGEVLLLRHGSNITTNARGASTGGNITIQAGFIVAVLGENSDIAANAVLGSGGNIQISTNGIFGLKFQPKLTPRSDITASSQFGVNGSVQINTIKIDPSLGLVELPVELADSSQQIATGCTGEEENSFVATGRGGTPDNPIQTMSSDRAWEDIRDLSAFRQSKKQSTPPVSQHPSTLVEAVAWHQMADGSVELIATPTPAAWSAFATCSKVTATASEPHL